MRTMEKKESSQQAVVNNLFGSVFGNVEQKYMKEESEPVASESPIALVQNRGNKIDFIRVANAVYELGMVERAGGGKLTKQDYFEALGRAFNVDLSGYAKDLSTSMSASVSYEKQTQIFDDMKEKHQDIYNSK